MGLQGILIMDLGKLDRDMPKILKELPGCVKQILWAPRDNPQGLICSRLPLDLRVQLRELMMIVLKRELPLETVLTMDFEAYADVLKDSKELKELAVIAMTKAAAPIEVEDLKELMVPLKKLYNQVLASESDNKKKNILKLVGGLLDSIDTEEVYEILVDIATNIQGEILHQFPCDPPQEWS